jgi:hypothetical protein
MVRCNENSRKVYTNELWEMCIDYMRPQSPCIVYSIGIRDIYRTERTYAAMGCSVFAFDCTIDHPRNLSANITFYPFCVGSNTTEMLLDGAQTRVTNNLRKSEWLSGLTPQFKSLPDIIKYLGHEHTELTMLKMDCEGCEWEGVSTLHREMPDYFNTIRMLQLEMHFVSPPSMPSSDEVRLKSYMYDALREFRVYRHIHNSHMDEERFTRDPMNDDITRSGIINGTCCFEISFVNSKLLKGDEYL